MGFLFEVVAEFIVEALAYVLSWKTWLCLAVALLSAAIISSLIGPSVPRLDIFIAAAALGLSGGLVWDWQSR